MLTLWHSYLEFSQSLYYLFLILTVMMFFFAMKFSGAALKGNRTVQKRSEHVLFFVSALFVLLTFYGMARFCVEIAPLFGF